MTSIRSCDNENLPKAVRPGDGISFADAKLRGVVSRFIVSRFNSRKQVSWSKAIQSSSQAIVSRTFKSYKIMTRTMSSLHESATIHLRHCMA